MKKAPTRDAFFNSEEKPNGLSRTTNLTLQQQELWLRRKHRNAT